MYGREVAGKVFGASGALKPYKPGRLLVRLNTGPIDLAFTHSCVPIMDAIHSTTLSRTGRSCHSAKVT